MSFKKVMHEINQKGLDVKTPYTPKQLSEQGYMSAARTSSDAVMEEVAVEEQNNVTEAAVDTLVEALKGNVTVSTKEVEETITPVAAVVATTVKKEKDSSALKKKKPVKKSVKKATKEATTK